jgi:hypothetical protein
MKKYLFLILLTAAFFSIALFAEAEKAEEKHEAKTESAPKQDNELENEESVAAKSRKTLLWSNRSPEKMTWNDAVNYCKNLSEKDSADRHLPNIDELRKGIIGCSKTEFGGECKVSEKSGCLSESCMTDCACSENETSTGEFFYWSSSLVSDMQDSVFVLDGMDSSIKIKNIKTDIGSFRCVRNIE